MFSAEDARKLLRKTIKDELNFQRIQIIKRIKGACAVGDDHIVLGDPFIHLFEDDYVYFEKLGYTVKRPEKRIFKPTNSDQEMCHYVLGIISW